MSSLKPTLLLILDGWGKAEAGPGNAVHLAKTPNLDLILQKFPHTTLECSGEAVGLPEGQMGNSEVGHLNIGAGRIVYQDITRIDKAIADGSFFNNQVLLDLMQQAKKHNGRLHLLGLVSDGGVHSSQEHIYALLQMAKLSGLSQVWLHAFLDGRDTPPKSGHAYIRQMQEYMQNKGIGNIASISGRYYAMDRDKRWERTELAYSAIVKGKGRQCKDPLEAVETGYANGESDEFVLPTVINPENSQGGEGRIQDNDTVLFFNFRADRARQLVMGLSQNTFEHFPRNQPPQLAELATMTEYDQNFNLPVVMPRFNLENILGEVCAEKGLKQLRIAETEKYAHVTYFFNGGREEPYFGEERILIPSPRDIPTYDHKPEMSVFEVTDRLCQEWTSHLYYFVVCNFANLDMVGHTGNLQAAVQACQAVDQCVGQVLTLIQETKGRLFLTADHGNAEEMLDKENQPHTAHSNNPVYFACVDPETRSLQFKPKGILGDIAPTILDMWGMDQPQEMTGSSLVKGK